MSCCRSGRAPRRSIHCHLYTTHPSDARAVPASIQCNATRARGPTAEVRASSSVAQPWPDPADHAARRSCTRDVTLHQQQRRQSTNGHTVTVVALVSYPDFAAAAAASSTLAASTDSCHHVVAFRGHTFIIGTVLQCCCWCSRVVYQRCPTARSRRSCDHNGPLSTDTAASHASALPPCTPSNCPPDIDTSRTESAAIAAGETSRRRARVCFAACSSLCPQSAAETRLECYIQSFYTSVLCRRSTAASTSRRIVEPAKRHQGRTRVTLAAIRHRRVDCGRERRKRRTRHCTC